MPSFQKKTVKAINTSQNWNRSIDTIPDGQTAYSLNARTDQQGEIIARPGLTSFTTLVGGVAYAHSMSRLNNYSGNLPFFTFVYTIGGDTKLFVGNGATSFSAPPNDPRLGAVAINPVRMPPTASVSYPNTTSCSGNPLTMVDAQPQGGVSGWKYIGDSVQMMKTGYYPGDTPDTNMARCVTTGMLPPVFNPTLTPAGGGLLTGNYQWICVFRRIPTGDLSNPSAASRNTQATPAIALTAQSVSFTLPTTPVDPQTGAADANVIVDVYRFGGTVFRWAFVGSGASGTSFTDDLPDASVLSAPAPSQFTDPATGLTRFNTFKPFVIPDIARFNTYGTLGTTTKVAGGDGTNTIWILTAGGGDTFNTGLLQGSQISINNKLFTVYQVRSSTVIEIEEDGTGTLTNGGTVAWAIPAGQLVMGSPCAHIWGPYGIGSQGFVVFGCGNSNAPGTLFWTNGNDPDGSDIANSLVVTSPSEPLTGGCVFNGVPYVFSTERMFRIYPQFGTQQFYTQEIGGGKGLWLEWSLNVQSNSIADQSISWRGKEGVYNYTEGGGVQSLTDANLYPFFPHENVPGNGIGASIGASNTAGTVFPFLNSRSGIVAIPPPDDTQPKYHRLTWFQGVLYYDYVGLVSSANVYRTAVYDARQSGGWVSFDTYLVDGSNPVSRTSEIAANNLKISLGGHIYDWGKTAVNDAGTKISVRVVTKQDDCDDARGSKLFGDFMTDVDPGGATGADKLNITAWTDYGTTQLLTQTYSGAGRVQTPVSVDAAGLGVLSRTFGLDISWNQVGAATIIYQYVFDYVPKPEFTSQRATDKTDDGYAGAKYLRGFVVEANTLGVVMKVNILVDDVAIINPLTGTIIFTVNTADQLELPFGVTPTVGYEFQVAIDASNTNLVGWELFQVRWVYEQWPDLDQKQSAIISPANGQLVLLRGFTLPIDTNGSPVNFQINGDQGVSQGLPAVTQTGKIGVPFALLPPMLVHNIFFTPDRPVRAWYNEIVFDMEPWPERDQEYSPWLTPAGGKPCHFRGFTMPIDTAASGVSFILKFDDGTTVTIQPATQTTPVNVNSGLKAPVGFYMQTPKIIHSVQVQPQGAVRCWYNEIVWDMEPWPELEPEFSPWLAPKGGRRTYLRGFTMPVDTGGVTVPFAVQLASGLIVSPLILPTLSTAAQKTTIDFAFNPPVYTSFLRIQPQGSARCWFDEVTWDAEEYPELDTQYSPVLDCGTPRAKFMQGAVIPVDTQGVNVTLQFVTDQGIVAFTSGVVNAVGKQTVTLAWPPFITHLIQIIPSGPCSIFWNEIVWIFEPEPELASIWQTPFMTHGLTGYLHQRLFWVAYLATASVIFTRTLSDGTVESYNLPSTGGLYKKILLAALPTKFLAASYQVVSSVPCRVYMQDMELHTKQWGGESFQPIRPIGSASVVKGADI